MTKEEFLFAKHISFVKTKLAVVANVPQSILPANSRRVAIVYCPPPQNIFGGIGVMPVNSMQDTLALTSTTGLYQLWWRDWGDMIHREWGIFLDTSINITIYEAMLDCPCEMSAIWGKG